MNQENSSCMAPISKWVGAALVFFQVSKSPYEQHSMKIDNAMDSRFQRKGYKELTANFSSICCALWCNIKRLVFMSILFTLFSLWSVCLKCVLCINELYDIDRSYCEVPDDTMPWSVSDVAWCVLVKCVQCLGEAHVWTSPKYHTQYILIFPTNSWKLLIWGNVIDV